MSKHKSNVNPDHYKTAGREPIGRDVVQAIERQNYAEARAKYPLFKKSPPQGTLPARQAATEPKVMLEPEPEPEAARKPSRKAVSRKAPAKPGKARPAPGVTSVKQRVSRRLGAGESGRVSGGARGKRTK